jgi:hypothetical protein
MGPPRVRFTLGTLMAVIAALALGMGLTRWNLVFGVVYFLLLFMVVIVTTPGDDNHSRRFRPDAKRAGYCYLAGVIGPTICLFLDPMVFQGGDEDGPILQTYRLYCYSFMGLEMVLFTLWLWAGSALGPACGFISGALWAGVLFALGIGLPLLPLSAIGLVVLIGALGFTPFFTAYAFGLQARLAARSAQPQVSPNTLLILQFAGAAIAVVFSMVIGCLLDLWTRSAG